MLENVPRVLSPGALSSKLYKLVRRIKVLHREFIELCPDPDATIDFRLKSNARNIRRKLSKQHNGDINEMEIDENQQIQLNFQVI
jgi:hypothetical protein|tara:strand:- start:119 stop:373 length:255 start_codon:yes stop_codon:yes gene_type:complete